MYDTRVPAFKINEPTALFGRFAGQGANTAPTSLLNTVAGGGLAVGSQITSKGLTLARTGVGALTLTVSEAPGIPQMFDAGVLSTTNNKAMLLQPPPNPFVTPYTLTMQCVYEANSVAVDIAVGEELDVELWFAKTSQP